MRIIQVLPIVAALSRSVPCGLAQDSSPLKTLYSFTGQPDGGNPVAGVVIGQDGALYGTTNSGGTSNYGTVFKLTPPASAGEVWKETALHDFLSGSDGSNPVAVVVIGKGGALYGTTYNGGASGLGTVFELKPPATSGEAWPETVLHSFTGSSGPCCVNDGANPSAGVVVGKGGVLYGTTKNGGGVETESSFGTVFELRPPTSPGGHWRESVLFSFVGCCGANPAAGVVIGGGGVLYGTTEFGGARCLGPAIGCGTVFQLASGTETVLFNFPFSSAGPVAAMVIGPGGVSYGTTSGYTENGGVGPGTVFSLAPPASPGEAWTETLLHSFTGGSDGFGPYAPVAIGSGGVLYGTTAAGGTSNAGTVFSLTPPASPGGSWTETVLYSFTGGTDGADPVAGLAIGENGALYGTTSGGGASNAGTVFALRP